MEQEKKREAGYSPYEQDLIKQLIQSRLSKEEKIGYETFEDYEVPPPELFSMLSKPAVTIKYKEMNFSTSCIRLFEGVKYILPILSPNRKRLAVIPLSAEESRSVQWARQKADGTWCVRTITSLEYIEKYYALMNWNRECRYKIVGRISDSPRGICLLFDLPRAVMFSSEKKEYIDPKTGEVKKTNVMYFPDQYKGRIGMSYDDYVSSENQTFYDQFGDLTGQTYSDSTEVTEVEVITDENQ